MFHFFCSLLFNTLPNCWFWKEISWWSDLIGEVNSFPRNRSRQGWRLRALKVLVCTKMWTLIETEEKARSLCLRTSMQSQWERELQCSLGENAISLELKVHGLLLLRWQTDFLRRKIQINILTSCGGGGDDGIKSKTVHSKVHQQPVWTWNALVQKFSEVQCEIFNCLNTLDRRLWASNLIQLYAFILAANYYFVLIPCWESHDTHVILVICFICFPFW